MSMYNPRPRGLFNLVDTGQGTTLSASGSSQRISLEEVCDLWLAVYVNGTSTGTTPTLDVQLDVQDADGHWLPQVAKIAQITTTPGYASISAGLHIAGNGSMVLPHWCRITWTLGGTTPVYPQTSICLYGR